LFGVPAPGRFTLLILLLPCALLLLRVQEVAGLLDRGVYDNEVLLAEGWVDGLKYEDEIIEQLKKMTGGKVGVHCGQKQLRTSIRTASASVLC
jgi:hypothetical protein